MPTRKKKPEKNLNPLFEPLDTQAITLINPNLFDKDQKRLLCTNRVFKMASPPHDLLTRSNGSMSSREESMSSSPLAQKSCRDSPSIDIKSSEQWEGRYDGNSTENKIDEHLQNLRDLRLDTDCSIYDDASYMTSDNQSLRSSKMPEKSRCLLLDALMSYLNSAVNDIAFFLITIIRVLLVVASV